MVTEREQAFLNLHLHYKNRILFSEGGLMEQPNLYLDAMEIIETYGQ